MSNKMPYWPNNTIYFLTGTTFLHYPYFKAPEQKEILLSQLKKVWGKLKISVPIFSIAMNHYHFKFYLKDGLDLPKIKQIIHGGASYEYQKRFKMRYKEMWQSSKVYQITTEEMDWKITGYIAGNLLKHKEASTFEELKQNPFSCYQRLIKQYNEELIKDLIYRVINLDENTDDQMDLVTLKETKVSIPDTPDH